MGGGCQEEWPDLPPNYESHAFLSSFSFMQDGACGTWCILLCAHHNWSFSMCVRIHSLSVTENLINMDK